MTPTFILVDGKWSDASVWGDVIAGLADHGRTAIGVQLGLDSFDRDVDAVQKAIREYEHSPARRHTIIDREKYGWVMADGIDPRRALVAAATQSPARVGIDKAPSAAPAWSSIPSSYLVAADDRALDAATQRELAARMSAAVTTIDAPHAVMHSHPSDVVEFLLVADSAKSTERTAKGIDAAKSRTT